MSSSSSSSSLLSYHKASSWPTMSKVTKVLIGVNGNHDSEEAFNFYAKHFHGPDHEALLVYVVKPLVISSNELSIHINDIRDKSMNEEKVRVKYLKESYEEKMQNYRIRGKINIIYYSKKPGKIICELAQQEHCSMIVIGCTKTGKGDLGSVVDYIMQKAPCAVSIIRVPDLGTELSDSCPKLQEFHTSRSSKDGEPRLRRISCPVMQGSVVPEGEACCLGTTGETVPFAGSAAVFADLPKEPKQRRHSLIPNMFQNLSLRQMGRKKRFLSHEEESDKQKD